MRSIGQFRPAGPYALTDPRYLRDVDEVRRLAVPGVTTAQLDEAVAAVNASPYGLGGSVYSWARGEEIAGRLRNAMLVEIGRRAHNH